MCGVVALQKMVLFRACISVKHGTAATSLLMANAGQTMVSLGKKKEWLG